MSDELLNALEACLAQLLQGDSLETALARYPDLADELRPLLETAHQAAQASYVVGGTEAGSLPKFQAAQRAYFLAQAADKRNQSPAVVLPKRAWWRQLFSWVSQPAYLGIFLVVLALGGYGLTSAAYQSLPGDALYGLKRVVENTQLSLADDLTRAKLQREFEARRLAEIQALAQQGRALPVDFVGVVQQKRITFWLVSDLSVNITPETVVVGAVEPGQRVRVQGDLQADGTISAVLLQGLDAPLPGATLEPAPTWTLTPAASTTSSATPASLTTTPTPSPAVASPTRTAVPPTAVASWTNLPNVTQTPTPTQSPMVPTDTPVVNPPTHTSVPPTHTLVPPPTTPVSTGFPAPTNTPGFPTATETSPAFPPPTGTPAPFPTSTAPPATDTPVP